MMDMAVHSLECPIFQFISLSNILIILHYLLIYGIIYIWKYRLKLSGFIIIFPNQHYTIFGYQFSDTAPYNMVMYKKTEGHQIIQIQVMTTGELEDHPTS